MIFLSATLCSAQKFTFFPEAGFLISQIDGDKLQGFHKRGIKLGIGTHYPFGDQIKLSVKTSYYRFGSGRENKFQDKLADGIQLEMGLNTIGLELSGMYDPPGKSIFFGLGLVHHQILDYDYKIIDNVVGVDPRMLMPSAVSGSMNNAKFFIGWRFYTNYRLFISYESSLTDILREDFFNLGRLRPYMMTFSVAYEFNPGTQRKSKGKKVRKPRTRS